MECAFYTIEQAAEYIGVPRCQVYNLCKSEGFPAKKIGKQWRIHRKSLEEWSAKV